MDPKLFGPRLKQLREQAGLTQKELAGTKLVSANARCRITSKGYTS